MSATYWVLVSDDLTGEYDPGRLPEGFRFTGMTAPPLPPYALGTPAAATWRQAEDDHAGPELDGRQVELVLGRRARSPARGAKGKPDAPVPQETVILERRLLG